LLAHNRQPSASHKSGVQGIRSRAVPEHSANGSLFVLLANCAQTRRIGFEAQHAQKNGMVRLIHAASPQSVRHRAAACRTHLHSDRAPPPTQSTTNPCSRPAHSASLSRQERENLARPVILGNFSVNSSASPARHQAAGVSPVVRETADETTTRCRKPAAAAASPASRLPHSLTYGSPHASGAEKPRRFMRVAPNIIQRRPLRPQARRHVGNATERAGLRRTAPPSVRTGCSMKSLRRT